VGGECNFQPNESRLFSNTSGRKSRFPLEAAAAAKGLLGCSHTQHVKKQAQNPVPNYEEQELDLFSKVYLEK